jgi:hypothetical protein
LADDHDKDIGLESDVASEKSHQHHLVIIDIETLTINRRYAIPEGEYAFSMLQQARPSQTSSNVITPSMTIITSKAVYSISVRPQIAPNNSTLGMNTSLADGKQLNVLTRIKRFLLDGNHRDAQLLLREKASYDSPALQTLRVAGLKLAIMKMDVPDILTWLEDPYIPIAPTLSLLLFQPRFHHIALIVALEVRSVSFVRPFAQYLTLLQ